MSYEVVVVESFEKQIKRLAKKYKSLKKDTKPLIESLETDPSQGDYLEMIVTKFDWVFLRRGKEREAEPE
ncbi:hypothetical protein [Dyadobacter sp. LHD-138]|uniref:hypothetical protein n=1 Tax=Dyadobacter sp. LHD-138 TaxID=3071413 RepID=UPI0027E18879|nr:hypothetical protein [Dyadobacter sp. LHD-138]MDQ6482071.1 hypothetical protein [Dyadobacter sp. LHD-138]